MGLTARRELKTQITPHIPPYQGGKGLSEQAHQSYAICKPQKATASGGLPKNPRNPCRPRQSAIQTITTPFTPPLHLFEKN